MRWQAPHEDRVCVSVQLGGPPTVARGSTSTTTCEADVQCGSWNQTRLALPCDAQARRCTRCLTQCKPHAQLLVRSFRCVGGVIGGNDEAVTSAVAVSTMLFPHHVCASPRLSVLNASATHTWVRLSWTDDEVELAHHIHQWIVTPHQVVRMPMDHATLDLYLSWRDIPAAWIKVVDVAYESCPLAEWTIVAPTTTTTPTPQPPPLLGDVGSGRGTEHPPSQPTRIVWGGVAIVSWLVGCRSDSGSFPGNAMLRMPVAMTVYSGVVMALATVDDMALVSLLATGAWLLSLVVPLVAHLVCCPRRARFPTATQLAHTQSMWMWNLANVVLAGAYATNGEHAASSSGVV